MKRTLIAMIALLLAGPAFAQQYSQRVGGTTGIHFSDSDCTDVAEIRVHAGWWIDSVQLVCYVNGSYVEKPRRGGTGGDAYVFRLQQGERITRVTGTAYGSYGEYIYALQFHTNYRSSPRYGANGPERGRTPFDVQIPPGAQFAGFNGMHGDYLHSLSVVYREAAPQPTYASPPPAATMPTPVLAIKEAEVEERGTRYYLTVTNRSAFSAALFQPAPDLPPCGRNTNSARTWVDIVDQSGRRLYGFCGLTSPENLDGIWFFVGTGKPAPQGVGIRLTDRRTNQTVSSNLVAPAAAPSAQPAAPAYTPPPPPRPVAPTLYAPRAGAVMDNACSGFKDAIVWSFDWEDVPGASQYHVTAMRQGARNPAVNVSSLSASSHTHRRSGSYIGNHMLSGWTWKVRARVGSTWGPWSSEQPFSVEPLDTDCR